MSFKRVKFLLILSVSSTIFLIFLVFSLRESEEFENLPDKDFVIQNFEVPTTVFKINRSDNEVKSTNYEAITQSSVILFSKTSTSRFVSEDFDEIKVSEAFPDQNLSVDYHIGFGIQLTDDDELQNAQIGIQEYSYNTVVSDKIPLNQKVPDTRPLSCLDLTYNQNLTPVSIVIVFHNEYLSVLLRTITSIFNRTPKNLITEVILVDDASTKEFLKEKLEEEIKTYQLVRIIRLQERFGLIQARMKGITAAFSDVIVIIDAHVEVNVNWLPPLITPVLEDPKTVTEPVFDPIDWNTFEYLPIRHSGTESQLTWSLSYYQNYREIPDGGFEFDNYENAVLLGATMAFNRTNFLHLGGFDPELQVWGGEQIELSFKTWLCGGQILTIPCSHVGHNFKGSGHHPYFDYSKPYIAHNLNRIAEVWMDEYKELYYYHWPERKKIDFGNITVQLNLKKELNCKPFKWIVKEKLTDLRTT